MDKLEYTNSNEHFEEAHENGGEIRTTKKFQENGGVLDERIISLSHNEDANFGRSDKLVQDFLKDSLSTHESKEALRKANFLANKNQGKNADQGFVLSSLLQQRL